MILTGKDSSHGQVMSKLQEHCGADKPLYFRYRFRKKRMAGKRFEKEKAPRTSQAILHHPQTT